MPLNPNDFPDQTGNAVPQSTVDPSSFPDQSRSQPVPLPQSAAQMDVGELRQGQPFAPPPPTEPGPPRSLSDILFNTGAAAQDLIAGIPSMATQFAKGAYNALKFQAGTPQQATEAVADIAAQAKGMADQTVRDVQSPLGSRENIRGLVNLATLATPAIGELAGALKPIPAVEAPVTEAVVSGEKPPVQANMERGFQLVPEPKPTLEAAPDIEQTVEATAKAAEQRVNQETGQPIFPETDVRTNVPSETAKVGGEPNASQITSPEGTAEREVRPRVGEETPLRQPGETAPARQGTEAQPAEVQAPIEERVQHGEFGKEGYTAVPTEEKPPVQTPSGISTERLQEIYGKDSVLVTKGHSPEEFQRIGQADTRDPYALLSEARKAGIASPGDVPALRAEHQRLLESARSAYGTPEYGEKAQQAADFANATKTVAHGPASEIFRSLQEVDKPSFDSPADFDNIVRERMNRESTPQEKEVFQKAADDVRNGNGEASRAASDAQDRLREYKPKEDMKFEEAVDNVRKQISELTKDCVI